MAGLVSPQHPEDCFLQLLTTCLTDATTTYAYRSYAGEKASSAGASYSNYMLSPDAPAALQAQQLLATPFQMCLERCVQLIEDGKEPEEASGEGVAEEGVAEEVGVQSREGWVGDLEGEGMKPMGGRGCGGG